MRLVRLGLLFSILLSGIRQYAYAIRPVVLQNSDTQYVIENDNLEIFRDSSQKFTFEQVSSPSFNKFELNHEDYPYAEEQTTAYWIRFKVKNAYTINQRWVFEGLSHHAQNFKIYIPDGENKYHEYTTGQNFNFAKRDYHVSNLVFELPSYMYAEYYVYVRVVSSNGVSFEYEIRTQNHFTNYAIKEYWCLGLYYGILLFIVSYFLILYFASKEKTYLFYIIYLVSCILVSCEEDGLGFQFIWPNIPILNHYLSSYFASSFFLISFIFYAKYFIGIADNYPKLNYIILGFMVFVLSIQFNESLSDIYTYLYIIPFLIVYGVSIYNFKSGSKSTRFFIIGQTFLLLSMIVARLRWNGLIDSTILTVYAFNFSVVLEGLIFSYAFVDKFNIIKNEKELAQLESIKQLEENTILQTKVNRELEEKVAARTMALKEESLKLVESNTKLEALMQQVNEMNAKLDYDNWQLNKKVKEEKKARVSSEQMSYEEFSNIYNTDIACLKYLEELKWKNGFVCTKCGNTKFIPIQKNLSRRCTKCAYIESATTGTIFQAIKFPLTKAFYIVYYCTLDKQEMTIDQLSDLLELRRNTCWSFRKRVLEAKAEKIESGKFLKDKNKFDSLILAEQ